VTTRLIPLLAKRLLHDESVTLIIDATLADLQLECLSTAWRVRLRAHRSAWVALLLACWHELTWDRRGPAWAGGMAALARLAALMLAYHASMVTLIVGLAQPPPFALQQHQVELGLLIVPLSNAAVALMVLACFGAGVGWAVGRAHNSSDSACRVGSGLP